MVQLRNVAQRLDHRRAQQIAAMLLRIVDDAAQFVVIGAARARFLRIEDRTIAQRGLLHDVERDLPALPAVALEGVERRAADDGRELLGQVERIVNAAVEAHSAQRIVHVRGIAGDQDPAADIGRGDALVHAIGRAVRDLVGHVARDRTLKQPLGTRRRRDVLVVERGIDRKQRAPDAGGPDQHIPLARIRDVGDVRQIRHRLAEIVIRRQRQVEFGDRDAVERGADRVAHHAADAVGTDEERSAHRLGAAVRQGHVERDAVVILSCCGRRRPEPDIDQRVAAQTRIKHLAETPLLALQPVRMIGVGAETRQFEAWQ